MDLPHSFSENSTLLGHSNNSPTNSKAISEYESEYGLERLKGYHDALTDILSQLGPVVWKNYQHSENNYHQSEPSTLRRSMIPICDLFCEQEVIRNQISKHIVSVSAASENNDTSLSL